MSFYSELDNLSLSELMARFHDAPLEGEEYGYTYYSEVALLIREQGEAGVEFLWNEAQQADTIRLRGILLADSATARAASPSRVAPFLPPR